MYKVRITQPTLYTKRNFQTASWWETYELQPGEYEVESWSNIPTYQHFKVPAIIVENYFASNFAGCTYLAYDRKKDAGKEVEVWVEFVPMYLQNSDDSEKWMNYYKQEHPTFDVKEAVA